LRALDERLMKERDKGRCRRCMDRMLTVPWVKYVLRRLAEATQEIA